MKKRITKLMSTLLCCVMLLGLFPTAAFAGAIRGGDQPGETAPDAPAATDLPTAYTVQCVTEGAGHTAVSVHQIADTASIGTVSQSGDSYVCPITVSTSKYADAYSEKVGEKHSAVDDSISFNMTWNGTRWDAPLATSLPAIDVECEYGVTYRYDNSVPAEVMATLPTNSYTYSVGQKVTTAAKPEDVTVGDYVWKFQTWQLNGVDVAPNTQIEMVQGGLTFTGIWTREAMMPAEYGVTYSYDNSVPAEVMATLPTNSYTYSVGQKVTTAAKPEDVVVGDYVWKFQTWQLNGVDVAPNTQIEMVQGGLTFTGIWTREAMMPAEYGVTYSYDNSVPAEVMATLPTNSYTYSVGQKVTTAAKPEDVTVGDYIWKFQTWQLNGVDVAPNTQIEMVQGGLTFTGIWTREAMMPAEYGVTYSYDNSVPAEVMATLPTNSYTYSVGQKVTTAAKPEDVTVGDYIWKFQTWQLNGVDVAPNTQVGMVQGGLTFTGIWTREAMMPAEYGVTYSYDNSVPAEVMATLPTNSYTYSVGQKVTTAAKPEDVTVGDYIWKFQTWQLNGVDVAPNTQVGMVQGGLTFTGIWTREAMMPAEYGVTYSYDNSVPAEVMATLPTNSYTYSVGQKVTTAAKPEDVTVGDYVWKFQTWQLNGVDVAPNTQIEMVQGGLTFTGIWTREAVKPAEYGVTYSYDNSVPAEVMATLPTNSYTYSVGQKVTTAAKPEDVTVGDYIWKFQTWQLNGVDVAPNTQIEMVQGGLTFTGIWTREAMMPAEYGVTYSYDNSVPAEVMATLPTNSYTYSVGQKVTTAAKPEDVTVGDYIWKFQTWQLNGVDVAPNTQIEMVQGGLTFTGIWTREAMMPAEYGVTYSYDNSVPAEVMATLPTNSYTYSVGQKVTTAAKPGDVTVGDYVWKFQTWQLNGVDVAPNTQIEMVRGGLTFTGIWTREAVKPAEYGVTYSYDNSVPAEVMATLPTNSYTYSVGQKVTTAAKPGDVTVGDYVWKFQTWQLNGVDVAPNTQIEMVRGGLTFTGIWTREAVKPAEYGVTYRYDNSVPAVVMATLPTNSYTYSVGQKVTTAAKPEDVTVGDYVWKFQTWQLNGVDVAPNTQIEMVRGGLTFTGIWTREAMMPAEYGVTYRYDNSVPAEVMATLPTNSYTYSVGQKVTTAAKPEDVTVGDYVWKFQTWQLNGVDVAPNTQIEMVRGGLTFTGIWTREAIKPAEYGVTYSYDNSVPAEVMATLPTNSYTYSVGQKVTTAAKPEDVTVGDYVWKFQTWQLNGVDVAPNTQIEMVRGGLTFTGIWTREAMMPAEYGVTYSYDNSVPAEVMATLPTNSYTYSVGQKVTTAAKPEDVTVGDYVWKFQTWQLNGVDVAPNTQIEMVQGGLTFTGIWTREAMKPAEYTVTFDANGGSVSPASAITGTDGRLSDLPTPTRSGSYSFDGWYTAVSGGEKVTTSTVFTENSTIYAHWTRTGGGSSGGSHSGGSTSYAITVADAENGSATASRKSASKGTTITVTATPDKGYELDTLKVTDKNGDKVKLTEKNGKYTFTMPASAVTVKATFTKTAENPFTDVNDDAYYKDAVIWAVENGITKGISGTMFSPDAACTRAQAVTFLWRAAGSPSPKSGAMPFGDVAADAYYHDAVLWAVENGITKGTSDTTFSPDSKCTRAQIVTFLWRAQKSPAVASVNVFTDVAADAYYADAVNWAVANGITSGTSAATFSPNADCTRAQIVTFLYRSHNG